MYVLPSTSRRCEPCPLSTNSGYGVQPAHVARAVLLTPPGMDRHAASNALALRGVSSPAASGAASTVEAAAAFAEFIGCPAWDVREWMRMPTRASAYAVCPSAGLAAARSRRQSRRSKYVESRHG